MSNECFINYRRIGDGEMQEFTHSIRITSENMPVIHKFFNSKVWMDDVSFPYDIAYDESISIGGIDNGRARRLTEHFCAVFNCEIGFYIEDVVRVGDNRNILDRISTKIYFRKAEDCIRFRLATGC